MATIQQLHKEAQDLREKAKSTRRQAGLHADKARGLSQHQDFPGAQVEEMTSQKLIQQAISYEEAAMAKEQEAGDQEQKVNDLELRKQELMKQADQLDREINALRGESLARNLI